MNYYECHITLEPSIPSAESAVIGLGWKYSAIDGDPVLGKGVLQYATKHCPEDALLLEEVILNMNRVAETLQSTYKFNVIRQKVELVVYDTKQKNRHGAS